MAARHPARERPTRYAATTFNSRRHAMGDKSPKNKEKRKPKKATEKKK
jgi:hypothetical protein